MNNVFELLHPKIRETLKEKGIDEPIDTQIKAIPTILEGGHVLLIAPTGTGKTEAALLPIFHKFLCDKTNDEKGIHILYITPLRALNRDMLRRTFDWGTALGIKIAVRHGDTSKSERAKQAREPPDMLITTPETLQILFLGKILRKHLRKVKWVIIDEIHELCDNDRGAQLSVAMERLLELTREEGNDFQRIGLSATIGNPLEVAKYLGGREKDFRKVNIVKVDVTNNLDLKVELPIAKNKENSQMACLRRCKELINRHRSTLCFVNTRDGAEILANAIDSLDKNFEVGIHHGSLSKYVRISAEEDFKNNQIKSLICTSSLELGIDIGSADFAIQYNSPREATRIVQRVGRSGHSFKKVSKGEIIATNEEDFFESIVIAKRALRGELEPIRIRKNPLSVLANQIVSMALENGKIDANKAYEIIKRAYPFSDLSIKKFHEILHQLKQQRTIWLSEKNENLIIGRRIASREYFFENISMIPDEKNYKIIDAATRKAIGTLDERFVLNEGYEGSRFILKGRSWIIIKKDEDGLLVSPTKEMGVVPSWIGEEIPVPFEVAHEVGFIRRMIKEGKIEEIEEYPCRERDLKFCSKIIEEQEEKFIVPDDRTVTIEVGGEEMIINACFGTRVNQTFGTVISALLAQSFGESVGINIDPYRISLKLPGRIDPTRIKKILTKTNPESLDYLLRAILKNSPSIRWELVHAARKFGALSKDFDYKNIGLRKIVDLFKEMPIFKEVIDKIIWEKMDIENTKIVLKKIQNKEIKIFIQKISPISLIGCEAKRELIPPPQPDKIILKSLKKRLECTDILLFCMNCGHQWTTKVSRVDDQPRCPKCGAILIAGMRRYERGAIKIMKKKDRTKEEERRAKRIYKNACLVAEYGKFALLALAGRGIGEDSAARILAKRDKYKLIRFEEEEQKFLRDILNAELTYARTRGFWDR